MNKKIKGLSTLLHEASGALHTAAFESDYNQDLNVIRQHVAHAKETLKNAERLLAQCSQNSNDCNWK